MRENLNKALKNELQSTLDNIGNYSSDELVNKLEGIYEKALVINYLNTRDQRREKIQNQVLSALASLENKNPIRETIADNKEPLSEDAINLTPEIKVVPHPDGPPPMPRDLDETPDMAEDDQPSATEQKTVEPGLPKTDATLAATNPQQVPGPKSIAEKAQVENKKKSLHTRLAAKALKFGLNDRLAYVKHLFEGNAEDFNRVVSQINTLESWDEANDFIENMIKPDYNWDQKVEFEERFVAQIKTKFE